MKTLLLLFALSLTAPPLSYGASVPEAAQASVDPIVFAKLRKIVDLKKNEFIYLDFWASWCNPCRKSFPWMNSMQEKYRDKGLKILAVNVDKEIILADNFLREVPASFSMYFDPEGELATAFQLMGMPSSFIIDSSGVTHFAHTGFFLEKTQAYEDEIRTLITPDDV